MHLYGPHQKSAETRISFLHITRLKTCPPCPNNITSTSPVTTKNKKKNYKPTRTTSHSGLCSNSKINNHSIYPHPKCYPQLIHSYFDCGFDTSTTSIVLITPSVLCLAHEFARNYFFLANVLYYPNLYGWIV